MGLESATYISELNTSNPVGATDPKSQGDNHIRLLKSALQATFPGAGHAIYLDTARADVADSATPDLGAAATNYVNLLGTTTVTSFGTVAAGIWRYIRFNAAKILTHNGTSLILPGAANITTAAGDTALAVSEGSGNWRVLAYQRADGTAVGGLAVGSITGLTTRGDLIMRNATIPARLALGAAGTILRSDGTDAAWANDLDAIEFVIDGGGSALTTGVKGDIEVPWGCVVTAVRLFADQSGSVVVDIWKDTYANFPPTDADSITASAVPTISAATKAQDSTLTGWTTTLAAGDILRFNVDSAATITRVTVSLMVRRTS